MRIIINASLDPAVNLACKEYVMNHTDCDVFMLWRKSQIQPFQLYWGTLMLQHFYNFSCANLFKLLVTDCV